ncbi:tetratricopeptide repeat protein [Pelagibius sp.]|uniref:tetratricopeptide repeat protein n=1 Tax=Pelagibius sp. TaxID=1931238 RepID=UPI002626C56B|nr:tetratricopeptide repeat protein [Pelagibius sp.]
MPWSAKAQEEVPESCNEGRQAMEAGAYSDGIELYADCLSHDGLGDDMRFEAHFQSGYALASLERYEDAVEHLEEAVRLAPDFFPATLSLGTALGELGDYEGGIEVFDSYARRYPVQDEGLFAAMSGWLKNNAGRYQEAVNDLGKAIAIGPEDIFLYLNRSNALANLGRFEESYVDLEMAEALEPSNPLVYEQRGFNLRLQGRNAEAIAQLDQALDLDPFSTFALLERGRAKTYTDDLDGAIADFSRVAELDPGEAWAYADRAQALILTGEPEQAMHDLKRALELSPDNTNALILHGELLNNLGRAQEARQELEKALAIDPTNSYGSHELARAYYGLGLWDESYAAYDRAFQLDPTNGNHLGGRAYVQLRLGNATAALEDFDNVVANFPDGEGWQLYRSHALAWVGRTADAKAAIEGAFAQIEEDLRAWYSNEICWDLLLQGETGLAEPLCVQAVDLGSDAPSNDSIAFLHWQLGRAAQAEAHLAKAFEISGGDAFFEPDRRLGDFPRVLAQGLLMYFGYRPDEPDMADTQKTRKAIESFERDHGLPADGLVSDSLLAALKAARP